MICHHRHHHCHHHCEQKQGASHFVQVKELSDNHYRPHHHDRSHSHQQDPRDHEDQCATHYEQYQARARSARVRRACALRALGLLLADGKIF